MYHRVSDLSPDPWSLAVSPPLFERQMRLLKRDRQVIPLREFVRRLTSGTLEQNAVAVTFDDGYADNLTEAAPILAENGIPATLFLATGFLGQERPFWWDELATLVLCSTLAPSTIIERARAAAIMVDAEQEETPDSAHHKIWSAIQALPIFDAAAALEELRAGIGPVRHRRLDRPMTSAEVRSWLAYDGNTIEPHTVSHPLMTLLSPDLCLQEIVASAETCRTLGGAPPWGFAYPYGGHSKEIADTVRASGVAWACSTRSGAIEGPVDVFDLPRLHVSNRSGDAPWEHP
jgi:peptidoglycan/xylan/chitin deacetylase (PgdA/CDA1 family)